MGDNFTNLEVRDAGIFPTVPKSLDPKAIELRARCLMAYAFEEGHIQPIVKKTGKGVDAHRLVLLTKDNPSFTDFEQAWCITHPLNTGCIYTAEHFDDGWSVQPCRLFLYLDMQVDLEMALRFYFQASLRWLAERPKAKQSIANTFKLVKS